jgi:hypothetical protein
MSIDIATVRLWFQRAMPEPTDRQRATQVGCHIEEYAEMLDAFGMCSTRERKLSERIKNTAELCPLEDPAERVELLDALCDQIVTAVGIAHAFKLDIAAGLAEVNASNWSKFDENGQPMFQPNGKIAKGPNYRKPDLRGCV